MRLTETKIRSAKPAEKPYKLSDGGGLFLLINPNGSRWWRLKYRFGGKEGGMSLGVYPDVSLKVARERRDEARRLLANGINPSTCRQQAKAAREHTFKAVALEWLALQEKKLAAITVNKTRWLLGLLFDDLGPRPISEITAPELLAVLRTIEERGTHETAHRAKQKFSQVARYAVATGRAMRDVSTDLRGALAPVVSRNHAAVTEPARIGELLRAIDGYTGQPTTQAALKLAPLVFVRPGELRMAQWSEFDLDSPHPQWRIPAARMKMGEQHIVPLSTQAVAILRELYALTGPEGYVFPSLRSASRPMSENTINAALRRLGYSKDEMTGHGFRSLASTNLNEQGFDPDWIEAQLAHAQRNKVRAAYNHAKYLPQRRKMMQAWADYLDGLRAGANVVPLRQSA